MISLPFRFPIRGAILIGMLAVFMSIAACKDDPGFCTAEYVPGIRIEVRDAETGLPAACGASAFLVSGEYSETLMKNPSQCDRPDSLQDPWIEGAYERVGTYSVLVIKDGYANWSRSGIRVFERECHVATVRLTANLEPDS